MFNVALRLVEASVALLHAHVVDKLRSTVHDIVMTLCVYVNFLVVESHKAQATHGVSLPVQLSFVMIMVFHKACPVLAASCLPSDTSSSGRLLHSVAVCRVGSFYSA